MLLVGQPDLESCVIEIDQVVIFMRGATMEIRGSRYKVAQDRRLELADIGEQFR